MSPLRNRKINMQLITNHKRPSPKKNKIQSHAQGFENPLDKNMLTYCRQLCALKGISLFTLLKSNAPCSMTVEAAALLPVFLFFFMNLSCAIEMIRLHGNLQLALNEIGGKLSIYGSVLSQEDEFKEETKDEDSWWKGLCGVAFSYGYIKNEIIQYTGEKYLEESPLTYGKDGLQFLEGDVFSSEDTFDIVVTYEVSPWSKIAAFWPFRMVNRYYGHVWNGYQISYAEETIQDIVYITRTGEVYHENRNCTHLQLSIRSVPEEEVANCRNENGGKYVLCQKCGKSGGEGIVWIAREGDCYHYIRTCSGLKRIVSSISREEAINKGYRSCTRCTFK